MDCYRVYELTIASEWPLPGLLPAADTRQIDIHIRQGTVAEFQPAVCFQASPQQVLVWLPDIARIRVCGGNDILVEPLHPHKHDAIALFLLNHALAIVLLQRGLLVLHAGAVLVGGQAGDQCVALAGPSGAGKSTLLAALHEQGYAVAGDELCVLRVDADGAMVLPGPRVMQVWAAALPSLALADYRNISCRYKLIAPVCRCGNCVCCAGWTAAVRAERRLSAPPKWKLCCTRCISHVMSMACSCGHRSAHSVCVWPVRSACRH
jgi:hypothetical protein